MTLPFELEVQGQILFLMVRYTVISQLPTTSYCQDSWCILGAVCLKSHCYILCPIVSYVGVQVKINSLWPYFCRCPAGVCLGSKLVSVCTIVCKQCVFDALTETCFTFSVMKNWTKSESRLQKIQPDSRWRGWPPLVTCCYNWLFILIFYYVKVTIHL